MRRLTGFLVALAISFVGVLHAQSTGASLTGYITDPTKAVIVGAKVIVINVGTNARYEAVTNETGSYDIPNLPPGTYRIEVEKPGFKTTVKSDVVLHVQDTLAINFEMAVGSTSEIVTVTGGAPLVNTESAAVSTVVDRTFAENLPMNGRSFQTLIELTPGVVLTASNFADGGQFSVNGQRAASNYWMVDGASANIGIGVSASGFPGNGLAGSLGSFSVLGGTNSLVSVDAMQEFRIQTSTYAPEFGRTPGGQISIVTRSGTNQLHGTLFDYLRNDVLDANDWFANFAGLRKPEERQNDFGGTFSGPIVKDRTFFFFSYEALRLRLPQTALTTVPDLNARQNALPARQPYLNAFPLPTPGAPDNVATGIAQFNASFSNKSTLDAYSIRIDHRLNHKLTLFGRYNYSPSNLVQRAQGINSANTVNTTDITSQTTTVGATWAISSLVVNDLRFNYSRTNASSHNDMDNFGGAVPLTSLPFPSSFTSRDSFFLFRIFSLNHGALFGGQLESNLQRQINIVDSLSLQKGSHSLKFGVDFRRLSPVYKPEAYELAAAFGNVPSAESQNNARRIIASNLSPTLLFRNLGLYAQDAWRIRQRLTLTYGLRWDVDFVPQSLNGPSFPAVTGFSFNNLSNLALAPAGTSPFKTSYGNVVPRLGVAYQLLQKQDWQTVLRGGFGVFYDLVTSEAGNTIGIGSYPFGSIAFGGGLTFPFDPATLAPPPITPASLSSGTLFAFDPRLQVPYTLEWNVAVEQALGRQQALSVSYVGASGRRLIQTAFVNAPNANFGGAHLVTNAGTSSYNGLQVQFQRRLSHGLQALASYTWSHSLDTGSAGSQGNFANALNPADVSANRGPSDFDIRSAFSAGITYDVPAPKINAFTNAILCGWSLQSMIQARSAPPVDIEDVNFSFFNGGVSADIRPDTVSGQPLYLYGSQYPGGKAVNPGAFMDPPVGPTPRVPLRQGTLGRNALRGFGATQWDFGVHRDFPIHESLKLQFRAEIFNVLNHPNFGPPNGLFGAGGFGLSTQMLGQSLSGFGSSGAGAFSPLYQIGGPRSIQFALKLQF